MKRFFALFAGITLLAGCGEGIHSTPTTLIIDTTYQGTITQQARLPQFQYCEQQQLQQQQELQQPQQQQQQRAGIAIEGPTGLQQPRSCTVLRCSTDFFCADSTSRIHRVTGSFCPNSSDPSGKMAYKDAVTSTTASIEEQCSTHGGLSKTTENCCIVSGLRAR